MAWIGAAAPACSAYPRVEVFNHPPTGYRAGVASQSTPAAVNARGFEGTGCASEVTGDVSPWAHYGLGAG